MPVNNTTVQRNLRDAAEEVSRLNSHTRWTAGGNLAWIIKDSEGHLLGRVNAMVCCQSGKVTFSYQHDQMTYLGIDAVAPVEVDSANLSDPSELVKLEEFDSSIVEVHGLDE